MRAEAAPASPLKSPYPYFGGKSRVAEEIWRRFGDVDNFVDPFCGSLAVLLARPHEPKIETVNDADRFICNFWRAVQADPDSVAAHADWPVNECDLESRHFWLITDGAKKLGKLLVEPEGYDAKIAGWWVWGACAWIGSGWCSGEGPWRVTENGWELRNAGQGINRQLPHLGDAGKGVNRKLPHLGDAGKGVAAYLHDLSDRLRRVRVACGDWTRVLTPSITFRHGMTGVLLDPPYGEGELDYAVGGNRCTGIASAVREWAISNGANPLMRIALCGYEGQHVMPDDWAVHEWKTAGGYSVTADDETQAQLNRSRERVWFSSHCLKGESDSPLFDFIATGATA